MCSLTEHIECFVDDLIDCFEEFVRKALIIIFVAVGTGLVMIIYSLKLINDRLEAIHFTGFSRGLANTSRPQEQHPIDSISRIAIAKKANSHIQELQDEVFKNNNMASLVCNDNLPSDSFDVKYSNEENVVTDMNTSDNDAKETVSKVLDFESHSSSQSKSKHIVAEKESNLGNITTSSSRPIAVKASDVMHQVPCPHKSRHKRNKCNKRLNAVSSCCSLCCKGKTN